MINSAGITGNLTDDAQLKALPTGTSVLEFSVAVNERRKRGDDWEDYPNYIDCVIYGKRADAIARYMLKGTKVTVEGRLHQDRWEDKEGRKRSRVEIIVDELEFMSRGDTPADNKSSYDRPVASVPAPPKNDEYDEDIPF